MNKIHDLDSLPSLRKIVRENIRKQAKTSWGATREDRGVITASLTGDTETFTKGLLLWLK